MKINKVIFCCDNNPVYVGFWDSISERFKDLGFKTKLFLISNNSQDINNFSQKNGEVIHVQQLENIPVIIQALMGKFYFTKFEPDTTWLIGDIDLYPIRKSFFSNNNIEKIDDQKYIHLYANAYGNDWKNKINGLAGYYHVAKGKTFEKELKFDCSFEEVCNRILKSNKYGIKFYGSFGNSDNRSASPKDWGWFCCEEMYTGDLLKNNENFIEFNCDHYPRIDRNCIFDSNVDYIDFHSPRPYNENKDKINKILNKTKDK